MNVLQISQEMHNDAMNRRSLMFFILMTIDTSANKCIQYTNLKPQKIISVHLIHDRKIIIKLIQRFASGMAPQLHLQMFAILFFSKRITSYLSTTSFLFNLYQLVILTDQYETSQWTHAALIYFKVSPILKAYPHQPATHPLDT